MKRLLVLVFSIFSFASNAQHAFNAVVIDSLEKIGNTQTPSKHFAKLYRQSILYTNKQLLTKPDSVRRFIIGFENSFASFFFKAHQNYIDRKEQSPVWEKYYSNKNFSELQFQFIGINAHINGDMGEALKAVYTYDTLKKYKDELIGFQKALNKLFDSFYTTTAKYKKVKKLHFYTLGTDKQLGKNIVLRWRKQQIKMAMTYYRNTKKYKRLYRRNKKTIRKYDRLAVKWMK
ncbi:DUF5995 family protein [Ferruginibacter sp. SUN002]|uniref:DUF5995 family protein n=1 Tax=Ferruginibacter sp. SUN002 TaxID=2937789 RepID=UPI003D35EA70